MTICLVIDTDIVDDPKIVAAYAKKSEAARFIEKKKRTRPYESEYYRILPVRVRGEK